MSKITTKDRDPNVDKIKEQYKKLQTKLVFNDRRPAW